MKDGRFYYVVIALVSFLPFLSVLVTSELNHTHDGFVHLARIAAYFKALQDGQIPIRWAGDLNYGYGMPLFNFIYHVPYLISSLFLFLGMGLVNAFKLTLFISFILSGIFMFAFAKAFFGDYKKAFLVAVFYQFAPFRLIELVVRGSFGEVYAYTFLPLVLFGLVKLDQTRKLRYFYLTSFATAFLILSHNALSLLFFGICILFIIFFMRQKKKMLFSFLALFFGLVLCSFYWIPALLEHKYTYGDLFMKDMFRSHFPPIYQFFIPNFFDSKVLQTGGIATNIGLFQTIALLFGALFLFTKREIASITKQTIIFSLVIFFGAFFFMTPASIFIWERISFLRQFQFPWRMLGVVSFASAFSAVVFFEFKFFKKSIIYFLLCLFTIGSVAFYFRPPLGYDKINENYYWNFPLNTTYFGETDIIWSAGPAKNYPKARIEFIAGEGRISNFQRKSNKQTFDVDASTNATLVSHTQYFPGWRVYVDEIKTEIEYQDQNYRGEITFPIKKGVHNVQISFGESPIRLFADLISFASLIILIPLAVFWRRIYAKA